MEESKKTDRDNVRSDNVRSDNVIFVNRTLWSMFLYTRLTNLSNLQDYTF